MRVSAWISGVPKFLLGSVSRLPVGMRSSLPLNACTVVPWMRGTEVGDMAAVAAMRPRFMSGDAAASNVSFKVPKPVAPYPVSSFKEERKRRERLATDWFEYPVITMMGEERGTIKLATAVFKEPLRVDIMQRVVHWQQSKARPPAQQVKTRSMVRGGGKKPWQQKGTGRARHGSIRSPIWRGGGKAHGPVARSFAFDLPKKVRRLGLRVALSARMREGTLVVVEDFNLEEHKTGFLRGILDARGVDNALAICNTCPENFMRAASNIPNFDTLPALGSNVYSILKRRHLLISKSGIEYLHTFLLRL